MIYSQQTDRVIFMWILHNTEYIIEMYIVILSYLQFNYKSYKTICQKLLILSIL